MNDTTKHTTSGDPSPDLVEQSKTAAPIVDPNKLTITPAAAAKTQIVIGKEPVYGFEETKAEDILIPRVKVIQALSPERQDGVATEGTILNSLTLEDCTGKRFIVVKQYYSNIRWDPDRNAEVRILCRSFDGRIGNEATGATLSCEMCKKNKFDNTKTGKDAQPLCTEYLNFLGFFEGSQMPVILSFAKTNFNEGKKLLSMAKSMRTSIWSYAYKMMSKKITKDRNSWYIMVPVMAGQTTEEEKRLAFEIYQTYVAATINTDYEDTSYATSEGETDAAIAAEI